MQATIPEPATLDRVKALTAHPAFSFANPNRVRALVHAFALGNQKELNRPDGAGYAFVVNTVLALNSKNHSPRGCSPPSGVGACWSRNGERSRRQRLRERSPLRLHAPTPEGGEQPRGEL